MSNYRKPAITGGTYFITQVTYQRIPWLCSDLGRKGLREAIAKVQEKNLWQRRFWEHLIRHERDYALHCDYIHYNPVRHGLCTKAEDWQFSSIHRFTAQGQYPPDWGGTEIPEKP